MYENGIDWPWSIDRDGSFMWRHLPYEERMKMISLWAIRCADYVE